MRTYTLKVFTICFCRWLFFLLQPEYLSNKLMSLFISVTTLCVFVINPSGFPAAVLQKMQEICKLSSETSSSLSVCLGLLSKQEGVSVGFRFVSLFERPSVFTPDSPKQ